jgi:hypothetical protein
LRHSSPNSPNSRLALPGQGQFLFLSQALSGERAGLEETAEDVWTVYFGTLLLARFDEKERKLYG